MKRRSYLREMHGSGSIFNTVLYQFIVLFSFFPRYILEPFTRRNFGERYFKPGAALLLLGILYYIPKGLLDGLFSFRRSFSRFNRHTTSDPEFWTTYGTWYAFWVVLVVVCFMRWREVWRNPSVIDTGKLTRYSGHAPVYEWMRQYIPNRDFWNPRVYEIIFEPLLVIVPGYILNQLDQPLGKLFVFCGIVQGIANYAAFNRADNYIMDLADSKIEMADLSKVMKGEEDETSESGFRVKSKRPKDPNRRNWAADQMTDDAEFEDS
jgi:hypothetical protein